MTKSMSSDVVDYGFNMMAFKPELEITFARLLIATRFQRLPPHFRPRPTLTWHWGHCLTFTDFGRRWHYRLPKFRMSASKTGSGNNFERKWWRRDSNGYPHIIDHARLHYVTANTCGLPRYKMAGIRQEVEIAFERWEIAPRFALLPPPPIFSALSDLNMILSTLTDFGRLPTIKMAATKTGNGNNNNWTDCSRDQIPTATPTFATMPDTSVTLSILTDVG